MSQDHLSLIAKNGHSPMPQHSDSQNSVIILLLECRYCVRKNSYKCLLLTKLKYSFAKKRLSLT